MREFTLKTSKVKLNGDIELAVFLTKVLHYNFNIKNDI